MLEVGDITKLNFGESDSLSKLFVEILAIEYDPSCQRDLYKVHILNYSSGSKSKEKHIHRIFSDILQPIPFMKKKGGR